MVVMYDVTVEESFKAVHPWIINVQVRRLTPEATQLSVSVSLLNAHPLLF